MPVSKERQREISKAHYRANKGNYIARARSKSKSYAEENRRKVLEYLSTHPCIDCKEADPIVLEFDHRDPKTKKSTISNLVTNGTWNKVLEEIEKCDVRCANCHRRKTAKDRGYYRSSFTYGAEFGFDSEG